MTRFLLVFAILAVSACGFTPLYGSGPDGDAPEGLDRIEIALIPDQSGVYLRNVLIDRFYRGGYPATADHVLRVTGLREYETDLDITESSEATRKQIRISLSMSLLRRSDGRELLSRELSSVSSYNVLGSQFTTRVSEADAREAVIKDLARQIENQTVLYLKSGHN